MSTQWPRDRFVAGRAQTLSSACVRPGIRTAPTHSPCWQGGARRCLLSTRTPCGNRKARP